MLGLARHFAAGGAVPAQTLAAEQGVPVNYLVQILIELGDLCLARSARGKEGGYFLGRPPAQITMGEVLRAIHGSVFDTPAPAVPRRIARAWQNKKKKKNGTANTITFQHLLDETVAKEKMYYI